MVEHNSLAGWLMLAHANGISPRLAGRILTKIGSARQVARTPVSVFEHIGLKREQAQSLDLIRTSALLDKTLRWLEQPTHHVLTPGCAAYPPLLTHLPDPPLLLYVSGNLAVLSATGVSIVGSRKATVPAANNARHMAAELASAGLVIVSGMALGIDQAAHRGALEVHGCTIAVMGTGPDRVYPSAHRELAEKIRHHGALLTEFPLGEAPKRFNFPRRNRLISGLSLATIVIEAAQRSGSLSTARHATNQGRDVMAMPGAVANPNAKGCHDLLREGAILVESAADVLAEIAPQIDTDPDLTAGSMANCAVTAPSRDATGCAGGQSGNHSGDRSGSQRVGQPASPPASTFELSVLDWLGHEPTTVDALVQRSGASAEHIGAALISLELAGRIAPVGGGRYTRC